MPDITLIATVVSAIAAMLAAGFSYGSWRQHKRDEMREEALRERIDAAATLGTTYLECAAEILEVLIRSSPVPNEEVVPFYQLAGRFCTDAVQGVGDELSAVIDQVSDPELMNKVVMARQAGSILQRHIPESGAWRDLPDSRVLRDLLQDMRRFHETAAELQMNGPFVRLDAHAWDRISGRSGANGA